MDLAHLLDDLSLPVEACGTTLDQRYISCQAHLVHMAARLQVVQSIENNLKALEPCDIEAGVLDIVVVGLDLDIWVELARGLFRNLSRRRSAYPNPTKN